MAAKTKSPNGVIDFATLVPSQRRYEWFTMDQGDGDDVAPLRVKAQRLTTAEIKEIPAGKALIKDVLRDFRHYFVAWNMTATTAAGDTIAVMPPAEMDEESFDLVLERLLLPDQKTWLYNVLKQGDLLKMVAEKKALSKLNTSPAPSPEESSPDAP